MGTNYYLMNGKHIGKESAAGLYCWICETTLCKGGTEGIHHHAAGWHDECPKCGRTVDKKSPTAVNKQLGHLNKNRTPSKKGVTSICSFAWAIPPRKIEKIRKVKNEYEETFTKKEFKEMLEDWCPIRYYNMIGEEFS